MGKLYLDWTAPDDFQPPFSGIDNCAYRVIWEGGDRIIEWRGAIDMASDVLGFFTVFSGNHWSRQVQYDLAPTFAGIILPVRRSTTQPGIGRIQPTIGGNWNVFLDLSLTVTGGRYMYLDKLRYQVRPS